VTVSGRRSVRGRRDLPELREHAARLLEHPFEPAREVGRGEGSRGPVAGVEQVLAPRVADDLAKASQRRDRGTDHLDRSPAPAPGRGAQASDQVDDDRQRQRREHAEEDRERDEGPRRAARVAADDEGGGDDADTPAEKRRQRSPPAAEGDAQDPAAQPNDRRDPERKDQQVPDAQLKAWVATTPDPTRRRPPAPVSVRRVQGFAGASFSPGAVAQWSEPRTHNPFDPGSNPGRPI
jgi:hypothetical protein